MSTQIPVLAQRMDEMAKWKTQSIVCVPLQTGGRALRVISLMNCAKETFGEHEMLFLHALCDYAAIAVDYKRS